MPRAKIIKTPDDHEMSDRYWLDYSAKGWEVYEVTSATHSTRRASFGTGMSGIRAAMNKIDQLEIADFTAAVKSGVYTTDIEG